MWAAIRQAPGSTATWGDVGNPFDEPKPGLHWLETLDNRLLDERKMLNAVQSLLLVGAMAALLAVCAQLLFGGDVWLFVFLGVALSLLISPRVSPHWVLRAYQARLLSPGEAGRLYDLLARIADRAGIPSVPRLYWIPSNTLNAFSVGSRDDAAIAITHGLVNNLTLRELNGVLAHETSHIANNDMRIMGLADTVSRLTHVMSTAGLLLALLALPAVLLGMPAVSLFAILLLVLAPTVSALLQMALSRTRELMADTDAARLTGDPDGLASALIKLEHQGAGYWHRLFRQGYRNPDPSLLRSHPDTAERIERLQSLKAVMPGEGLHHFGEMPVTLVPRELHADRDPTMRWFLNIWR